MNWRTATKVKSGWVLGFVSVLMLVVSAAAFGACSDSDGEQVTATTSDGGDGASQTSGARTPVSTDPGGASPTEQPADVPAPTDEADPTNGGSAVLRMDPVSQTMTAGDEIEIDVWLDEVGAFGAFNLIVGFDPKVLTFEGWDDRGFLTSSGRGQVCQPESFMEAGMVRIWCSTIGIDGPVGPEGSGQIAELDFKTSCAGSSVVELAQTTAIYNTSGEAISINEASAEATVSGGEAC